MRGVEDRTDVKPTKDWNAEYVVSYFAYNGTNKRHLVRTVGREPWRECREDEKRHPREYQDEIRAANVSLDGMRKRAQSAQK